MMSKCKFVLKQYIKMLMQGVLLPCIYRLYCKKKIDDRLVVFADLHNKKIPFSMQAMHKLMEEKGYKIIDYIADAADMKMQTEFLYMVRFMRIYAAAQYVFICDNFLPVASCKKRRETIIVQLWHSGGLLKRMGFDTQDDIPSFYRLNPYRNYDLVTVSSEVCIPYWTHSMRLSNGIARATGLSRTDMYFDAEFIQNCYKEFYSAVPAARGKKVVLWAPTFRGSAAAPYGPKLADAEQLQRELGSDWIVLTKMHPLVEKKRQKHIPLPTEKLLPVADVLITDYSSVLFDYLLFERPYVLYAPDKASYEAKRGFCIDYYSLSEKIVENIDELSAAVLSEYYHPKHDMIARNKKYHMGNCDGRATERIWNTICKGEELC